ncbi:MAG: DUF5074 domain-containing protein, partial [Bacteroidota bacterium]
IKSMKHYSILIISALFLVLVSGCKKEDFTVTGVYSQGVFIANEGPFQTGTGTISFLDTETGTINQSIFESVNGRPLGNIVNSIEVFQAKAYIVVNNAAKIEVADAGDFTSIGVINGLAQPRYFVGLNSEKGYVSQWGDQGANGAVVVVDLETRQIRTTIETGGGPEAMVLVEDKLYVANSGGFGSDNKVLIINTETDEVESMIEVGDKPTGLQLDANGNLWVLCAGAKVFDPVTFALDEANSTAGRLIQIDLDNNNSILTNLEWSSVASFPGNLVMNETRTVMYYLDGTVYRMSIEDAALPTTPFLNNFFYGLDLDPNTGILYGTDAGDFASDGQLLRFMSDGSPIDTFPVGIIPGSFYFQFQ